MEKILILDFGSQYTQLIARRIREANVYCEIFPYNHFPAISDEVKGVILSGSPFSVHSRNAPNPDLSHFRGKIPILAVCYGAQLLAHHFGGEVQRSQTREYGRATLSILNENILFKEIAKHSQVWMSHGDTIIKLPENFKIIARTETIENAAFQIENEKTFGVQFHPEVFHTTEGNKILRNFVINICQCKDSWTPSSFIESTISELREKLQNDKVILALSGGVDSTVAATLLHKAINKNLICIFVDNGLLRKDEFKEVLESYKKMGLNILGIDASNLFLENLKGVENPEVKRKIIGKTFIDVFEKEALKLNDAKWLAQGTIYPDVIESVSVAGPSATIKSHHNVGGLPEKMNLKIIEPLRLLFKDEVRRVGAELGIENSILKRHPFPGPGLGIRILGEVTRERIKILQEVDALFINGLREFNLYDSVWQAGAILLPIKSVGVMGDERTYEQVAALRAVTSTDGMTADWALLPHNFLSHISNLIINQVRGINRVVYDISSKPPATIEWE